MISSANDIQLRELRDTVSELQKLVESQQEAITSLTTERAELQNERDVLKEQVDYLTKKLFGKKSEHGFDFPGQYNLFNELEVEAEQAPEESDPDQDEAEQNPPKKRKPRATNEERFKGMPVKKEYLDIPEDERFCSSCGTPLVYVGEEFVRRIFDYTPGVGRVIDIYSRNYKCPADCKESKAEYPIPRIVKGKDGKAHRLYGMASSSTVAWILYQKFVNGVPLYRQEKDWEFQGISITRSTMAKWVIDNSEAFFGPLCEYFHRKLLTEEFLMADETPVQVLKEPERRAQTKSFMWLYRTGERTNIPIILYRYSETRAGDNAKDYLSDYAGYIMCDGYSGYNKLTKAKRCACWAHVRRYLIDAIPKGKQHDHSQPAVQGLLYVDQLFRIERSIKEKGLYTEEEIRAKRLEKAPAILEGFFDWVDKQRPVKKTRFDKAITYIKNRRPFLATYLENGWCSFDNNASERAIKDFVIGRKNWLFSDTPKGAHASAMAYSIVATAKANGVNPYHYLKYLLDTLPTIDLKSDAELEKVSPWNPDLKATIKEIEQNSIM